VVEKVMTEYSSLEFILIESPGWDDAAFYRNWLLAAAQAQRIWTEAVETDCEFKLQIERLEVMGPVQLGTEAFQIVGKLRENVRTMIVRADTHMGTSVALMAWMGFLERTSERYQMILPSRLDADIVKGAGVALAATEDKDYDIHPEFLVSTMPLASARTWQARLQQMAEKQRLADRKILLCDNWKEENSYRP
jgi:hypothetical protein